MYIKRSILHIFIKIIFDSLFPGIIMTLLGAAKPTVHETQKAAKKDGWTLPFDFSLSFVYILERKTRRKSKAFGSFFCAATAFLLWISEI